jgi:hypothetical protein
MDNGIFEQKEIAPWLTPVNSDKQVQAQQEAKG